MPDILHVMARLDGLDHSHMYGPDRDGRYLAIKSHMYDANPGVSTLTLRAILPAEIAEWISPLITEQKARTRLKAIFGG